MKTPLLLASASPRRRDLLKKAGIAHEVAALNTAEIEPDRPHGMTPAEFVWRNALRKARAAARLYRDRKILAADTVVALGVRIFGKPRDRRQATSFLKTLSGQTHEVLTAVILIKPGCARPSGFVERTEVTFRKLTTAQISKYLSDVHVLDKAGAYALQEKGAQIVAHIRGSRTNVVGLPMERVRLLLRGRRAKIA